MKLMVIGYATHGKDTACNLLRDMYGLTFVSSSYFVMERAVRPYLEIRFGISYDTADACYADRINHRDKWHDAIAEFNGNDPARLGRELYSQFDIYCGNRSVVEFEAMKKEKLFDYAFWIDRGLIVEPEPLTSNKLYPSMADYIIDNNGDLDHLKRNVQTVYNLAFRKLHIA